jgi:hypothetical protein
VGKKKRSLDELLALASQECQLAIRDAQSAVQHARNTGQYLLDCEKEVERGGWMDWLRTKFCAPNKISYRTATKWMQVASYWPVIEAKLPPTATIDQAATLAGKASGKKRKKRKKPAVEPPAPAPPPPAPPAPQVPRVQELTAEQKMALESAVNAKLQQHGIQAETEKVLELLTDLGVTPEELASKLL